MLKLKFQPIVLALLACSFLTAGCGNEPVVGTSPPDEIKPLGFPEKYFNTDNVTVGQMPEDLAIGTPKSPLFFILDLAMVVTGYWNTIMNTSQIWEERRVRK